MAWVLLLAAQVVLVRASRSRTHRRLGHVAIPLAVAIWASGIAVGLWVVGRDLPSQGDFAYAGLAGTATSLTLFIGLVIAAVRLRRRPDWHKRLILLATIVVLWPAFFRFRHLMPFIPRPDITLGLLLTDSLIFVAAIRDKIRWGRAHPAWLYVGTLVFAEQVAELWAFNSGLFTPVGRALHSALT